MLEGRNINMEREAVIMENRKKAERLIRAYKKESYAFGIGVLDSLGKYISEFGRDTLLVVSKNAWAKKLREDVHKIIKNAGIRVVDEIGSARPNSPVEDVLHAAEVIAKTKPASLTCVGGGSAIDALKAANVLATFDEPLESFYGIGNVKKASEKYQKTLFPFIAAQVTSGSGSHLSKYSNITDFSKGEKKLIIDEMIIPDRAVFDYQYTSTMGLDVTMDGAMDGLAHSLEVYYGYPEEANDFALVEQVCLTSIEMAVEALPRLIKDLANIELRRDIGLATDLGGYAIMLHGTSGPHLNSFAFVDILSHGRACSILTPYYTVFFAPNIENKLQKIAYIYKKYMASDAGRLGARDLGLAVASAMLDFSMEVGFPTKLENVKGFDDKYMKKAIEMAKNPVLRSKLENMPVKMDVGDVDRYMGQVLLAAKKGDIEMVENI
jgi:alcohol dehydrogenase